MLFSSVTIPETFIFSVAPDDKSIVFSSSFWQIFAALCSVWANVEGVAHNARAIPAILRGSDGLTHAVRVPADPFMLRLLEKSGPIYSTSVNISGERSLLSFEDVLSVFDGTLDFIVKGEGGKGSASTIVDMSQKPYRVVRMGAFDPRNLI